MPVHRVAGVCRQCGASVELVHDSSLGQGFRAVGHQCGRSASSSTKGERLVSGGKSSAPSRRWSNAKKTTCASGHRHASKMEARVCDRLTTENAADRLVQQIRLPLLRLAEKGGTLKYMSVDFGVVDSGGRLLRLIDAKAKGRVSRDWPARKRALELSFGVPVEETDK